MMSADTQETKPIQMSVVSSFKLQQACKDYAAFPFSLPCTSKHLG
jgi:hypothetical protein